ncbi:hypothetical protein AKJ16_DCAP18334 [Drosera capensis]
MGRHTSSRSHPQSAMICFHDDSPAMLMGMIFFLLLLFVLNRFLNLQVNAAISAGAHEVMPGWAAFYNPWQTLGLVDNLVYGDAPSGIKRRKPVLNLFHSEPGNTTWKRNVDVAFHECGTVKSHFEETLGAIPDWVLDSPVVKPVRKTTGGFLAGSIGSSLAAIKHLTTLEELTIQFGEEVYSGTARLDVLNRLRSISLYKVHGMATLPVGLQHVITLRALGVRRSNLIELPE